MFDWKKALGMYKDYNIPVNNVTAISASRLTYEKGFHILIESLNNLNADIIKNFTKPI